MCNRRNNVQGLSSLCAISHIRALCCVVKQYIITFYPQTFLCNTSAATDLSEVKAYYPQHYLGYHQSLSGSNGRRTEVARPLWEHREAYYD